MNAFEYTFHVARSVLKRIYMSSLAIRLHVVKG